MGIAQPEIDLKRVAALAAVIIAIVVLWDTWAVYPLRLLVVFFHEISHGIMAIVTGGSIVEIQMSHMEGGVCVTRGGMPFLILSAGYLGSLLWGGLLLTLATRTHASSYVLDALGVLVVAVSLIWVRPLIGFGFGFGLVAGALLLGAANVLPPNTHRTILATIGLTSCMYAVVDIKSDILDRPGAVSDAVMLAERTWIPAVVWGAVWITISVVLTLRFLFVASRATSRKTTIPPFDSHAS